MKEYSHRYSDAMSITAYACFVALVEEESSRRAADNLGMTFNNVLYHLDVLELHFQRKLIYRQRRTGKKITPHGEIIYERAKALLVIFDQLYEIGKEYQNVATTK